jgi:hypothetical protein
MIPSYLNRPGEILKTYIDEEIVREIELENKRKY